MNTGTRRSLPPLVGMCAAVMFVGCEAATAVATATSPTSATKCGATVAGSPTIGAAGGSGVIRIGTQPECTWNASSEAGWISALTPSSGQGSADLAFRAMPNTAPMAREGNIVVNDTRLRVVQEAAVIQEAPRGPVVNPAPGEGDNGEGNEDGGNKGKDDKPKDDEPKDDKAKDDKDKDDKDKDDKDKGKGKDKDDSAV